VPSVFVACENGRLDAGENEVTFTPTPGLSLEVIAFPYADLLRVYLLMSRAGDISINVNARAAIQTFDRCEPLLAARGFMEAVRSHGIATDESGFGAVGAEMLNSRAQAEPPPIPAASQYAAPPPATPPPTSPRDPVTGIAAGVGVSILGAALWAGLADASHYRLSLIGLVIGLGIAFVFRRFGLSGSAFAIVAAVLAVGGCALGDIGAGALIVSSQTGVGAGQILTTISLARLMNFDFLDALFYALAAYAAFRGVARAVPETGPPPTFWGKAVSRRVWTIRIASFVAVAGISVVVALGHSNGTARKAGVSGFLEGTCIVGVLNGPSIMNVDCSRTHNARIDQQLTDPGASCAPGDDLFVPQSPNPSLCLNFNDHNP
jgi:hypothetical protein